MKKYVNNKRNVVHCLSTIEIVLKNISFSSQIRIVALAVIVESKKSTLTFTKIELDFVIMFLNYNLGERVEYVPLIKKVMHLI